MRDFRSSSVSAILLAVACGIAASPRRVEAFDFSDVEQHAKRLASEPYREPERVPQWLIDLDYEQYRGIRFRPERALWKGSGLPFSVQFFHPGLFYDRMVKIQVVTRSGVSPVAFSPDQFEYGPDELGGRVPQDLGYAGFRIHYPIKGEAYQDEVTVFLGASYFRAVGRDEVYGLSARGIAIDTALASGEEFPWFREFWIVKPSPGAKELTLYALLDSPSLAGAYRFVVAPGPQTRVDVEMNLFPRKGLHKLGVAPLTSMFLRGENGAGNGEPDYRPEVHDSDGLLVEAGSGEWLWRPLENPARLSVTSFDATDPRGFGLVQRDRSFDHYEDFAVRSDLRPSAWVVPKGSWGAGHVELVEIPTRDDTNDNVVTYWVPDAKASADRPFSLAYSLWWYGDDPRRPVAGRVVATRRDEGGRDGAVRLLVDFEGEQLHRLPDEAVVEGVVSVGSAGGGTNESPRPAVLLAQQVLRNPVTGGWRLVFQMEAPDEPVELRAFLRHAGDVLTETWSYLLRP
jgi:periplasmic glucans biosynthesis protein